VDKEEAMATERKDKEGKSVKLYCPDKKEEYCYIYSPKNWEMNCRYCEVPMKDCRYWQARLKDKEVNGDSYKRYLLGRGLK